MKRQVFLLALLLIIGSSLFPRRIMSDPFSNWYDQGEISTDLDAQIMDYTDAIHGWTKKDGSSMMAAAYASRGLAYYHEEAYDFALQDYDKAISMDQGNADFYSNRGLVFSAQRNYDGAIQDFTKVITLDPKGVYAYFSRGLAYEAQSRHDLAIADYTKAIELDPQDPDCYYYRGLVYANQDNYDSAIADFSKAIDANPKYAAAYYQRALAYREKGEQAVASRDFADATKLDGLCCGQPGSPDTQRPLPGRDMAFPCARCHMPVLGLFRTTLVTPKDNPPTPEKYELGKLLFFDKRMSPGGKFACATCHNPSGTFTDNAVITTMLPDGRIVRRKIPTLLNRAFSHEQFIDGRAPSLEEQIKGPLFNPMEMKNPNEEALEARIGAIPGYRELFKQAFGTSEVTVSRMGKAIATFVRTIFSGDSAYDRYVYAGDGSALSKQAMEGMKIFFGPAGQCAKCHNGPNLTDERYHNIGIGMDKPDPDPGRYYVTQDKKDFGAFKTPTLRDVARRDTFMHDGRFTTLKEVMDYYVKGGVQNPELDPKMIKLTLTPEQEEDVIDFLKSLNGHGWQHIQPPPSFPQ